MMKDRCLNPKNARYDRYGGRGIAVCQRWMQFENFYADMGNKPSAAYSIERVNNNGNYEPGNCIWATALEQNNNNNANHLVFFQGRKMSIAEAYRICSPTVELKNVYERVERGWNFEEAASTPLLSQSDREVRKLARKGVSA